MWKIMNKLFGWNYIYVETSMTREDDGLDIFYTRKRICKLNTNGVYKIDETYQSILTSTDNIVYLTMTLKEVKYFKRKLNED